MSADHQHPPLPAPDHDGDRFTIALFADVKAVLERHGYRLPADATARHQAIARTLAALAALTATFEGGEILTTPTAGTAERGEA